MNEKTSNSILKIIAHELIHLRQYFYEELIIDGLYVTWMGENFDIDGIEYEDRPWENEAYSQQTYLGNKIISILL